MAVGGVGGAILALIENIVFCEEECAAVEAFGIDVAGGFAFVEFVLELKSC